MNNTPQRAASKTKRMLVTAIGAALIFGAPDAATGGSVAPARFPHVKRVSLHESAEHRFDAHHRVGNDVLQHAGKVVGHDSFTEFFNARKDVFRFALALKYGMIVGRVVRHTDSTHIDGPILCGSGRFAGIEGTATLHIDPRRPKHQVLILRYRL
jgi:hypothetical protein